MLLQLALPFGHYLTVFSKSKYQLAVEAKLLGKWFIQSRARIYCWAVGRNHH